MENVNTMYSDAYQDQNLLFSRMKIVKIAHQKLIPMAWSWLTKKLNSAYDFKILEVLTHTHNS